jgi:hypothetical protein
MEQSPLSRTHQRLLGSLLFVLEQKTEQIEHILRQSSDNASYRIEQNLSEPKVRQLSVVCEALKEKIGEVAKTFAIPKRRIQQYHYLQTIQSQMWELMVDSFSDKLKGYGDKLKAEAKQVDPAIQALADLVDELKA